MDEQLDYTTLSTEELYRLAKEYNDNAAMFNTMQLAEKILLNSLYGALGTPSFRYFDINMAESITAGGRLAIRWIERKLNEFVNRETGITKDRIVLIDTDSVVLNLEDIVKKNFKDETDRAKILDWLIVYCEDVINPYIEECYIELSEYMNAFQQKFKMKRENIVNTMINVAAKNYVMEVYNSEGTQYTLDKPKMKIMGLKIVKSDIARKVRTKLKSSLPILLHGTESEVQQFIKEGREWYMSLPYQDIANPRGVSTINKWLKSRWQDELKLKKSSQEISTIRNLLNIDSELYIKGTPNHVKGCILYNSLIDKYGLQNLYPKIGEGDKVKVLYLKTPNPSGDSVIAFPDELPKEFGLNDYIDYETMFEKSFETLMQGMIAPMHWNHKQENTLDSLFG